MADLDATERTDRIARSPFKGKYDQCVDRDSAFEMLRARADRDNADAAVRKAEVAAQKAEVAAAREAKTAAPRSAGHARQSAGEAMISSAARAIGSSLGRQLIRGILGSLRK